MCTIGTTVSDLPSQSWSYSLADVHGLPWPPCHLPVFALVNTVVGGGVLSLPYSFQLAVSTFPSQNHETHLASECGQASLSRVNTPKSLLTPVYITCLHHAGLAGGRAHPGPVVCGHGLHALLPHQRQPPDVCPDLRGAACLSAIYIH